MREGLMSRQYKLDELNRLLFELSVDIDKCVVEFDSLNKEKMCKLDDLLKSGPGMVVIRNVVSQEGVQQIRKEIGKTITKMYDIPGSLSCGKEIDKLGESNMVNNELLFSGGGPLYNSSYVDNPFVTINGSKTYFTDLPSYFDVNMFTMIKNPEIAKILVRLCHGCEKSSMMSWDACEFVEGFFSKRACEQMDFHESNKKTYKVNRYQAMVNDDQDNTKLMFTPYSWDPRVIKLISELEDKSDWFDYNGRKFIVSEDVRKIIRKFAYAPERKSMIIWRSGVVHFEANCHYV